MATAFLSHLREGVYTEVLLKADHYRQARDYIARFDLPLKAPDALHLAVSAGQGLPLITADRQLARNAATLGIGAELVVG